MADKHVRVIIEFDIDEESLHEKGIHAEDVFNNIVLRDNDVIDGFEIFTAHPDFDCASDFFLCAGSLVSKEFIQERNLGNNSVEADINSKIKTAVEKSSYNYSAINYKRSMDEPERN